MKERNETKIDGFRISHQGDLIQIQQTLSWPLRILAFAFVSVWITLWSVFCVMLTIGLIDNFQWFVFLFAIAFYTGWFAGAAAWITTLSPGPKLTLTKTELVISRSHLVPALNRRIAFENISKIQVRSNLSLREQLVIKSSGMDAVLYTRSQQASLELRDFLCSQIPHLVDGENPAVNPAEKTGDVTRAGRRDEQPETTWAFENGFAGKTILFNKGSFEWIAAALSLGFCLFYNSIVGVFLVNVLDGFRLNTPEWIGAILIIPFVLVGLCIVAVTAAIWMDPFRMIRYTFSNREITWRHSYLGIGMSKQWSLVSTGTISIQHNKKMGELSEGDDFELAFATGEGPLTILDSLTLAEAEWIAIELED